MYKWELFFCMPAKSVIKKGFPSFYFEVLLKKKKKVK